jgi:hypothetical protein
MVRRVSGWHVRYRWIDELAKSVSQEATDLKVNFPEMDDAIFEVQVSDIVKTCIHRRLPLSRKLARYLRRV